ncbi:MAG: metallophosphoesterase, partial [Actinobacteria bacterium]|nr:metallophosphoesterase [Actinomycetota bacterium]
MKTIQIEQQFAVFSDVHGNLPALDAILADIERRGVARTFCLGDLVGYGPSPNEVALLVRDSGIPTLMGNYD